MSVYFVTCRQANAVKIGSSLDPWSRLKAIQTGCPLPITLEAVLPGNHEQEFAFHRRFEDDRMQGEWFTITDMIEAIIAANPAPADPPDYDAIARKQRKRIALDPREQSYADAIEQARKARPSSARKMSQWERAELRESRSALNRRIASGDIHFPFRTKELA